MPPAVMLPVKCAESGSVITITSVSPFQEDSVAELKCHLAAATGIPPEDQILLIGPPYKQLRRLDPPLNFSSSSSTTSPIDGREAASGGAPRSIYLYNRRTLDEACPIPEEARLNLALPELPTESDPPPPAIQSLLGPSSSSSSSSVTTPLYTALSQYERLVSLNLAKGQAYVERGRRVLEACLFCLEEQRIQRDAGEVAVCNLVEHFEAIDRDGQDLLTRHHQQQAVNRALLDNFEPNLAKLEARQLHPALRDALKESIAQDPRAAGSGMDCGAVRKASLGAGMDNMSLLDCVPVGRVKDWYRECKEADVRLAGWMSELEAAVIRLREGVEHQREERLPVDLNGLEAELEGLKRQLAEQEKGALTLERNHRDVVDRIVTALSSSSSSSSTIAPLCQWLEDLLNRQAGLMAALEGVDHDMLSRARTLANHKTQTCRWLMASLLAISRLQSEIQGLRSDLAIGEQAVSEERRHFSHLDHLERLSDAYDALLVEISRRRAYSRLFELKVKDAVADIARFREGETNARAEFLRQHACHLMPVFSQIFPGMQDRPPHFHAQNLTPEPKLPAVKPEDLDRGEEKVLQDYLAWRKAAMAGTSSTLEGDQHRQQPSEKDQGGGASRGGLIMPPAEKESLGPSGKDQLKERCLQQDMLIAKLQAQVQSLTIERAAEAKKSAASKAAKEDGLSSEMSKLREENEALRSGLTSISALMEETRQAVGAMATDAGAEQEVEGKDGTSPPLPPSALTTQAAATCRKKGSLLLAAGNNHHHPSEGSETSVALEAVNMVDEVASALRARLRQLEGIVHSKDSQLQSCTAELTGLQHSLNTQHKKISFCEFNVGDVALFLPTSHQGENRTYLAFHVNCPHRYLSHESLESIRAGGNRFPDFILGKIVYIETLCAKEDPRSNPFKLHAGTIYYIIHVSLEPI